MNHYANVDQVIADAMTAWKPPPKLTLSGWADLNFYLSAESSAQPGRWKSLPYQVGMLDAITDPAVTQISVMKSARVGYTKCMNAAIGYFIEHDPSSMLVVQPTVDGSKIYSKEEIAPMLRDVPCLAEIRADDVEDQGPKGSANTMLHKSFPGKGCVLSMVGANAGAGFRSISRRVIIFDEVDAYPPSAGSDGDPVKLGIKRSEYFWNRKILAGSTPLISGRSRIEELFEQGDQRRYFVPCPQCQHMAPLVFSGKKGHVFTFDPEKPEEATFTCQENGCVIEHRHKRDMVIAGEWRAAQPFTGHASFHIWAAYSFSPNATWTQLAKEFLEAKRAGVEQLKTFVNTVLGETWKEKGDAPDWQRIYDRREPYAIGSVPAGVEFLTAGVDVQKDRWVYEVVGWGAGKESWSIESGVIPGDTAEEAAWLKLNDLLNRTWQNAARATLGIHTLAVDSGFNTQMVYSWARNNVGRVIAIKGSPTARAILGAPTPVEVRINGKKYARGCKVWAVGVDIAKAELYGWLRLVPSAEKPGEYPDGFCHFPEYGPDFFKQLTAEQLVTVTSRKGYQVREWQQIPGRENHVLDARIYSRAAANLAGLDRMQPRVPAAGPAPVAAVRPAPRPKQPRAAGGFLSKGSGFLGGRGKSWLKP